MILPAGRRSELVRELPGTGSQTSDLGCARCTARGGFTVGSRQFANKFAPTPSGQKPHCLARRRECRYAPGTSRKTPSVCSATSFSLKRCGKYSPFTKALA
ncbi:hypothetical protein CXB37_22730 [Pseudomonas syringae pv. syringae]|nr:hypothetical protein CXB37_22730 [Pseudomonas syringae pv. syringae]